jgi:hypothetical protein
VGFHRKAAAGRRKKRIKNKAPARIAPEPFKSFPVKSDDMRVGFHTLSPAGLDEKPNVAALAPRSGFSSKGGSRSSEKKRGLIYKRRAARQRAVVLYYGYRNKYF